MRLAEPSMVASASPFEMRQQLLAQIVHLWTAQGLRHAVLSPGSRSAPLAVALASQPDVACHVVYDERSAGYVALGLAQQTGRPVALLCTSGTATLNLAPAVVEAFYQRVPLLVLTADRPPEWIDQQDNQAIHQERLYEPHVRGSFSLPVDLDHPDAQWHTMRIAAEAWARGSGPAPGPVHIDVPLREPLYPDVAWTDAPPPDSTAIAQRIDVAAHRRALSEETWAELARRWQTARRRLVVAGLHRPDPALRQSLEALGAVADFATVADITANLFPGAVGLRYADAILGSRDERTLHALQPDLVLAFGGSVTSRYLKQLLRQSPVELWRIDPAGEMPDTFQRLRLVAPLEPAAFFAELARRVRPDAGQLYASAWAGLDGQAARLVEAFLEGARFGEFRAVHQVMRRLPAGSHLQLGNSMPIRYANFVGLPPHDTVACVHGNRGASGIDGTVSTAVGAALATSRLTTLLTGDLAFFYDRNGLWHPQVPANLRIVVLNNHGGGIFDIIDGPARLPAALHQTYFLTPQPLTARRTAADHGLDYFHADDPASLERALAGFFEPGDRAAILEIETDMATNTQVFADFKSALARIRLPERYAASSTQDNIIA